ncbi:Arylsulfotransferase-domain-containing protein [Nemania sp. NC0429]|nr:Arylsulfotransferase-domain-containing protein [Nemania sp. NC0429]
MIPVLLWLLLTVVAFDAQVRAYDVFSSAYLYEFGWYGLYPTTRFKSSELTPPRLNFAQWDEQRCSEGYYLVAQKGKIVSDPGPTIFDARGELVWADHSYGVVFNFQMQSHRGRDYLTFWSSPEGSIHGYGRGTYYMLDSSYELFRKLEPAGEGLRGDLHEFRLTDRGTALITVYNPVPADLTPVGGPAEGWALDCLVQEIDVDTGALVFEWRAAAHVALADTVRAFAGEDDGTTPETAFDFFHLNSVDVDGAGNYILSARHTSSILCVSPRGDILWTLGGKANGFRDASGGRATDFMYQHDARYYHQNQHHDGDGNATHTLTLSLFDNAAAERAGPASPHDHSRGLLLRLDTEAMTATLVREYADPANPRRAALSQGSMQVLDDRVVLGYGWLPFITELSTSSSSSSSDSDDGGHVLCAVELAPWISARWGLVNNYRAFKAQRWVGTPTAPPDVHLDAGAGRVYVSWNGATEVRRWVLQGAEWADLLESASATGGGAEAGFVDLEDVVKESFETAFAVGSHMPRYLRVAAVDGDGVVLARSRILDRRAGKPFWKRVREVLVWGVGAVAFILVVLAVLRRRGRRALWESSARGLAFLAAGWDCAVRGLCDGDRLAAVERRYAALRWWKGKGRDGAAAHEMEPMYRD